MDSKQQTGIELLAILAIAFLTIIFHIIFY